MIMIDSDKECNLNDRQKTLIFRVFLRLGEHLIFMEAKNLTREMYFAIM